MKGHVLRNKHINSFEASILLAYSIFARESNALLYTFTEDPNQLTPLHGMLSKKNFNRAMDMCEALAVNIQFFEKQSICLHFFYFNFLFCLYLVNLYRHRKHDKVWRNQSKKQRDCKRKSTCLW